jgi:hypothetical protein
MKKIILVPLAIALASSFAFAKKDEKQTLISSMTKACKTELAKDPALTDTTDGEAVWKNLEDKEHSSVKLSKACHTAHEKYEDKYHRGEEENETH